MFFSILTTGTVHRHDLPYETDGVVVKVNHFQYQDELGYTAKITTLGNGIQVQIRAGFNQVKFYFLSGGKNWCNYAGCEPRSGTISWNYSKKGFCTMQTKSN
jgi:hypothetical protein